MIWITSDLHLNHNKEFVYATRGFENIYQMNENIIFNYNEVVKYGDIVYILGDLCLGGANSLEDNYKLLRRLQGQIYIVRGNHDSDSRIEMYKSLYNVRAIENATYLKYQGYHFYLSHYPSLTANFDEDRPLKSKLINLCGHTHTTDRFADFGPNIIYHCEVDAHNYYPVSLDEIISDIQKKEHCL